MRSSRLRLGLGLFLACACNAAPQADQTVTLRRASGISLTFFRETDGVRVARLTLGGISPDYERLGLVSYLSPGLRPRDVRLELFGEACSDADWTAINDALGALSADVRVPITLITPDKRRRRLLDIPRPASGGLVAPLATRPDRPLRMIRLLRDASARPVAEEFDAT